MSRKRNAAVETAVLKLLASENSAKCSNCTIGVQLGASDCALLRVRSGDVEERIRKETLQQMSVQPQSNSQDRKKRSIMIRIVVS